MITSMKGKGFFAARDFVEMMAAFGADLSKVVGKRFMKITKLLEIIMSHMSELDQEVNHPDVILDVAIDKYNEAEEELNNLMDEVDPVVENSVSMGFHKRYIDNKQVISLYEDGGIAKLRRLVHKRS